MPTGQVWFTIVPRRSVIAGVVGTLALGILGPSLGFHFAWGHFAVFGALVTSLAAVGIGYGRSGRAPRLAALATALAIWMWTGIVWGFLAYIALAIGMPYQDERLASASRLLGFDHHAFAAWVAQYPSLLTLLRIAYDGTVPGLMLTVIALALSGAFGRLRRLLADQAVLLGITISLSILVPARGLFVATPLDAAVRTSLPPGAGDFHRSVLDAVRDGQLRLLDPFALEGLVSFPSFHTAMALLIARAAAGVPLLGPAAALFGAAIIVAALPLGGHYVVDIIATFGLYGGLVIAEAAQKPVASRWRTTPPSLPCAAVPPDAESEI